MVTEQQPTHHLLNNLAALHQFVEVVPDAVVVVNRDGHITLVNTQTEQLFGYSRTELLGQPLALLLPERFRQSHTRYQQQYFSHPTVRPMGTGLNIIGLKKDGSEFPASVALNPLEAGGESPLVFSTIRDITAYKEAESRIQAQQELLNLTLKSIGDAVVATDANGAITFVNPAAEQLTGQPAQALLGKNAEEALTFIDEHSRQLRQSPFAQTLQEGRTITLPEQTALITRQGREISVDDSIAIIRSPDGVWHGVVMVLRDFTTRKQLAQDLNDAKEKAEAANLVKSEFLATMSHELRTPLTIIMGYVDLLIEEEFGPLTEEGLRTLHRVKSSTLQLLELINAMIDLNRMEAGRFVVQSEEIGLADLFEQVRAETQGQQEQAGLAFEWRIAPNLPTLLSDRAKLKIVLKNLIGNAVKFTEHGSITIEARSHNHGVELSVTDTGIGIPEHALAAIFEPFYQVKQETARPHEGTGLGLHIVKRMLEWLGGSITVESTLGKGSTFRVWLPQRLPDVNGLSAESSTSAG
jgi:protein-histidine pros-kinase